MNLGTALLWLASVLPFGGLGSIGPFGDAVVAWQSFGDSISDTLPAGDGGCNPCVSIG